MFCILQQQRNNTMFSFCTKFFYLCLLALFVLPLKAQQKKFTLLPSSKTGITFRNDIAETPTMFYYLNEYLYNGGGVSVGDINNDGLSDIYFSATKGENKLYVNLGDFKFKDITTSAGVNGGEGIKTGVNMVDINGDGFLDIMICKSGYKDAAFRKKILYINNGNETFTNKAKEYGLEDASYTTQAYFFDYDNDGDKDVYFVNHPGDFSKSMTVPATMQNGKLVYVEDTNSVYVSDRLYENKGNKFLDITKKAGLINHAFGLSASVFDFNKDGFKDIYVANDMNKPDYLYINNKNGTFTNRLSDYVSHTSFFSMGSDIADINNDGYEDLFVADMAVENPVRQKQLFSVNQQYDKFQLMINFNLFYQYPRNCLQLNNGDGTYSEIANHAGIAQTDWSWAPLMVDLDNDGWKDMYITNGLKRDVTDWDYKTFILDSIMKTMNSGQNVDMEKWLNSIPSVKVKNYLYHNNSSLAFDNYTEQWIDEPASFSSGAAYADLDNDGDMDLLVNNVDDEAFVFKNNTRETSVAANYLRFRLLKSLSSLDEVYGATVTLTDVKRQIQVQHYDPQRGFLSSMEHVLHFGIGAENSISKVEIEFPTRKKIVLENVKANQIVTVYESDATIQNITATNKTFLFTDISSQQKFKYTQVENDFIDFKREPLIPYKCSSKGPYYAKADVNGDGKEDIFIGGAAGIAGKLMIQNLDGSFVEKKQIAFTNDKAFEDMDATLFDADNDGDKDLYVVSGGASFNAGNILYQDRLYLNDGKGNFTRASKALPTEGYNGSCVITLDIDNDGDLDLFVGGHVLPGKFPQADKSILLQNNKGVFINVTDVVAKECTQLGIINSATWRDVDGDKKNELILSGEWMAPSIFKLEDNVFKKSVYRVSIVSTVTKKDTAINLNELTGWWYCLKATDIDNDGDMDFVLGNRGTNVLIKGNYYEPCTVFAKDFDNNGSYDAVLGYYNQGNCYPLFSRDQLIDQMPFMRKKFIRYKDFSGTTLEKLFSAEQQKGMNVYKTNFFESGVLLNEGSGGFRFIPFPEKAQLSNINDMQIEDFDNDGIKDVLVCGNSNDAAVMIGNLDATPLLLLKGLNNGLFTTVLNTNLGLKAKGECRKLIYLKENDAIFLLKNNAAAQHFLLKK
jgi:enediyne biosynthesis protein E4